MNLFSYTKKIVLILLFECILFLIFSYFDFLSTEHQDTTFQTYLKIMLFILFISVVLFSFSAYKLNQNLSSLIHAIKALPKEDYNIKPIILNSIFLPLSEAFNNMTAALLKRIHNLEEKSKKDMALIHQLEYNAYYDPLTHLPNRSLLLDRLNQAIARADREKKLVAIVYLDLDGFKSVNDSLGHSAGDKLLIAISKQMNNVLREEDTLARIGGDEFVIILQNIDNLSTCKKILERLLYLTHTPISINQTTLQVSSSIGVSVYPYDNADGDRLIRHADHAMYIAKQSGKNRYHFFNEFSETLTRSINEEEAILKGLENNEFILYYQPKIDLITGKLIGAEALLRWKHPLKGLISPFSLPLLKDQETHNTKNRGMDIKRSLYTAKRVGKTPYFHTNQCQY